MYWCYVTEDAKTAKSVLLLSIYGVSVAQWNVSRGTWSVLLHSKTRDTAYTSNGSAGDDPGPRYEPAEICENDVSGYMPVPSRVTS